MGICPNCGSWVDEGDICHGCGGTGGYSYYEEEDDDSYNVKISADQKISRARYIINSEMSYDNSNLHQARRILGDAVYEIDECLRQGNVSEEFSLKSLKTEIDGLKGEIEIKISRNDRLKREKEKRERERKKSIKIFASNIDFGDELPIFKLVKEDESRIVVYQGDNKIGFVSNDLSREDLRNNSNAGELTHLPKISYARLRYEYYPDKYTFPRLVSAELIDDSQMKQEELRLQQENILKRYPTEQLITIAGTGFYNHPELREGMELKLVKEPDNIHDNDAIAVYLNDSKIGYVANSQTTACRFTVMASNLNYLPDISYAKYLMHYNGRYHIARRIS